MVPALHKNRQQIREIFQRTMNLPELGDQPHDLADAARVFLREKFLRVKTGVSGANFLIAETGGVCIVESEGNGRMCLTLPETLIAVAGIDKVIPRYQDLEVLLQLLPRSATGERMNPYTSVWTGVDAADGPRVFHVVLMDNARTEILADAEARQTLNCIRCAACQNACPVYRQTGGHAYGSVYAGPIGAILTPQLQEMHHAQSLPYASSLCGACYEVCPVKINIPEVLIHLRNKVVKQKGLSARGAGAMRTMGLIFRSERRFRAAQRLGRVAESPLAGKDGWIGWLPGQLGWLDAGEGSAGDAEGDVSRLVGEAGEEWQLIWLQIRLARRCCAGFGRQRAGWRTRRRRWPGGDAVERKYKREATRPREAILELLEDRLQDYDARVVRA